MSELKRLLSFEACVECGVQGLNLFIPENLCTLCYVKNLESQLAESKKQVQELVEMAEQAMRQWKMYMTDFQRDDLDELLKNPANAEAHIYKRLEVSLSKHKLKGKLNEPSS